MGTKPNYFKIGLFVLLAVLILLISVVIFGASLLKKKSLLFETYFDNSVHGLSTGSPVEARGVKIGRVEHISFVGDLYPISADHESFAQFARYVRVVVAVDPEFMLGVFDTLPGDRLQKLVKEGMRIRYATEILTGIGYLEAEFLDPNRFPVLNVSWTPEYFYLPSAPSELRTLKDSVDRILYKMEKIDVQKMSATAQHLLVSLDQAITDANVSKVVENIQALLTQAEQKIQAIDTAKISQEAFEVLASLKGAVADANVPKLSGQAQAMLAQANQALAELNVLLARPQTESLPANLPLVVDQLHATLLRIDRLIATKSPQIDRVLDDTREISENLKQLTESLNRNPSSIIFSKPPRKTEPK
ncbi:MAG: MlaD family protein [Phycisphaerae bacterium]|nr:MlaD family protein [Phycisphaerae bacterium]